MIFPTGSVLCGLDWLRRQVVGHTFNFVRFLQTRTDVFTLAIHRRINLVGNASVALVFFKSDVMRSSANPNSLSIPGKRRFPNAEVMAAGNDSIRLCLLVAK